jgi:chloride channel protein, CIC family
MEDESPQPNVLGSGSIRALSPLFWMLLVVTGAGAGVAGGLLMLLLRAVQHVAWPYGSEDDFLSAVQKSPAMRTFAIVTAAGVITAVVRFMLRRRSSVGHGSELAANIWFNAGRLDPLRTFVNAIVSIVIVAMGAPLGREAAPKQTGALIASMLAGWAEIPDGQRRLLAACGGGAGIAAVYNVPFGGAMFSLEVLLGTISLPLVPPALVASLLATAVSWLFLPNLPTYDVPSYAASADQIVWALVFGPIAGLVSVGYVRLIAVADRLRQRGGAAMVAPVLVFAALGALALPFPEILGNGKDVVQRTYLGGFDMPLVAALLVLRPLATAACLGSGAPGGLFTPTMTVGALLGALFGDLWLSLWPGAPAGSFAIVGSAAVLAASTQGPVSAVVLVIELTRRLDPLMVPTILAVAGAVLLARLVESSSIYSVRIHLGRWAGGRAVSASERKGFIALSSASRMNETLHAALSAANDAQPVYVVDEAGKLVGEVVTERLNDPPSQTFPLEIATAADFASSVAPILTAEDSASTAAKFKASGAGWLPVVDAKTGELVGVRRRPEDVTG